MANEEQGQQFNLETHNGFLTVENSKTGDHRTFKVWTEEWDDKTKRTVSLLIGPDRENWQDWRKFAFVDGSRVKVWRRLQGGDFEKFAKILANPARGEELGLVYHLEGRCRVCNRPLTNPESIQSGIGPICSGR